ncbi:chromatin assembly factor 1 subunit A [Python bivittatus]|uniref:Chromatin assembly factor 1 subunit A n=1 Tax=Python bivittatus TaxID=176946 RepID=A0A9F5J0L0_PYTBI|nr:chromatin assembly factor 1 subunit A [Python bivittatus]XP_025024331.1 chromatin assembly factor 1 subunit A [Python bivittatus]
MECRNKAGVPARKLIQARLPFKRLNPIPKEKLDTNPDVKKARSLQNILDQNTPCPALPHPLPDNVENSCEEETETHVPKLVNGKGPLDNFVQKSIKYDTSQPVLLIDLTGDPHHGLNDNTGCPKSNNRVASLEETSKEKEGQPGFQNSTCNNQVDPCLETCLDVTNKELSSLVSTEIGTNISKEDKPQNVIFEQKMPVVVLEDILAARSPQAASLERSLASENETMESCPEVDTPCTNSSLSSLSLTSSPESLATKEHNVNPLAASTPVWKASPKVHRSSEEKEKLKLQKDQERADKLQKLQAKREERGRLKKEAKAAKERAREEAKRKKEEEKELKDKERREKKEKDEKEKAEKQRAKEEKRKERQEALEAKLEEKRKKEEEKRLKEEEKRLKAEKAEITRFFQKPKTQPAPKILAGWCGKFAPFEIKENMVLAPLCRVAIDQDFPDRLDRFVQEQSCSTSFLAELKGRDPRRSEPTLLCGRSADGINSDVVIVGSSQAEDVPERKKFGRMKLLQFCENHRPAYWGTWNKRSSAIRPRSPWAKDMKLLDYEVESDEEWEEEEPGESLSHSEGDEEEDGGEEEDDDDGFFVPHGYLSEDEGVTEECDPENYKARQKLKAKEWDELITKGKRFRVLQPVKIGCIWEGEDSSAGTSAEMGILQQFTASLLDSSFADEELIEKISKKKTKDQQILAQLLPLLHGNVNGSKVIIQEFRECCRLGLLLDNGSPASSGSGDASPRVSHGQAAACENAVPSKARLKRIISENSIYEKRPEYRMCWYVHPEVLKNYGQEHLPVPCQWNYISQVPSVAKEEGNNLPGGAATQAPPVSAKRKSTGSMSITKFMRRPPGTQQVESTEMDGFQADTEEEDDDECIIIDIQQNQAPELRTSEVEPAAVAANSSPNAF